MKRLRVCVRRRSLCASVVLVCGCAPGASAPPAAATAPGTPRATPTTTQPAVVASLSDCPADRSLSSLPPLARLAGGPDDAVATPAGDLWISLHDAGRLVELSPAGTVLRTIADDRGPEGIEVLPDGRLLLAEQAPDRIDLVDPAGGTFTPWLQLEAAAAGEGIDGLGIDGDTLLVPDSAGGRLLRVPIDAGDRAGTPLPAATRLGRPVSAWPLGGGADAVATENPPGLIDVTSSGVQRAMLHETSLDDVMERDGVVYVTNLAGRRLEAVDPRSGLERVLISGAPDPQGLAITPAGELVLVDEDAGVVVTVPSCG